MRKGGSAKPPVKDTHLGTAARLDVLWGRLAEPREREKGNRSEALRADPDVHTKKRGRKSSMSISKAFVDLIYMASGCLTKHWFEGKGRSHKGRGRVVGG